MKALVEKYFLLKSQWNVGAESVNGHVMVLNGTDRAYRRSRTQVGPEPQDEIDQQRKLFRADNIYPSSYNHEIAQFRYTWSCRQFHGHPQQEGIANIAKWTMCQPGTANEHPLPQPQEVSAQFRVLLEKLDRAIPTLRSAGLRQDSLGAWYYLPDPLSTQQDSMLS